MLKPPEGLKVVRGTLHEGRTEERWNLPEMPIAISCYRWQRAVRPARMGGCLIMARHQQIIAVTAARGELAAGWDQVLGFLQRDSSSRIEGCIVPQGRPSSSQFNGLIRSSVAILTRAAGKNILTNGLRRSFSRFMDHLGCIRSVDMKQPIFADGL
jgi:hypothetical protein